MNEDLAYASEEGIFTKDISKSIEIKQNDIAVHSWKDVPINPSKSSQIFGTLKRGDPRDILFLKRSTLKQRKSSINIAIKKICYIKVMLLK